MAASIKILQKVKSLLALANDQAGKPEGTLAAQLAKDIIDKYNIHTDELQYQQASNLNYQPQTQQSNDDYQPYPPYAPSWQAWRETEDQQRHTWQQPNQAPYYRDPLPVRQQDIWTAQDQYIYEYICTLINNHDAICNAVNRDCSTCFWYECDADDFPFCGYFEQHLDLDMI